MVAISSWQANSHLNVTCTDTPTIKNTCVLFVISDLHWLSILRNTQIFTIIKLLSLAISADVIKLSNNQESFRCTSKKIILKTITKKTISLIVRSIDEGLKMRNRRWRKWRRKKGWILCFHRTLCRCTSLRRFKFKNQSSNHSSPQTHLKWVWIMEQAFSPK